MKKLLLFSIIAMGQSLLFSTAQAQFANYFELHSIAASDVNMQIVELVTEDHLDSAQQLAIKAFGNLQKLTGVTPELNTTTVFEVGFDDAIVSQAKPKLNYTDIYSFAELSDAAKNQVVAELEKKYSSYFFVMALQVRKLKLNYASVLFKQLLVSKLSAAEIGVAETTALELISSALAVPFLLKNSKNGIVYGFDFLDILNESSLKRSIAAEYASVNARLTDLYVQIFQRSKSPALLAIKGSKRTDPIVAHLNSKKHKNIRSVISLLQQQEGNKKYVQ